MTQPILTPGEHCPRTAVVLADACDVAYANADDFDGAAWRYQRSTRFELGSMAGCVLESQHDAPIVAFRGSDPEIRDWLHNVDLRFVPGPYNSRHERVHAGFMRAARWLLADTELVETLLRACDGDPSRPVFLTGHSLGGALATLVAAALSIDWTNLTVYTFGAPRVGNRGFAAIFDREVWHHRYVNRCDFVPRLPWRFGRYRHSGELRVIDSDWTVHVEPGFWKQLCIRWGGLRRGLFAWAGDGARDHSLDIYRRAIFWAATQIGKTER